MQTIKTVVFILVVSVMLMARVASTQECMDCHMEGNNKNAPVISFSEKASHAPLDCSECHPGDDMPPCPPGLSPVKCGICHQDVAKELGRSSHGKKMLNYLKEKQDKVKLKDICARCHGDDIHNLRGKDDPLSLANRTNVYKTCLVCHHDVQPIAIEKYLDSIHGVAAGNGNIKAAVCTDCHGTHYIEGMELSDSSVFHSTIPKTCSKCHPDEYSKYMESRHWETVAKGYREAPVCTDCHGEHGIRSRRDPLSPAWVGNITKTCSSCHESEVINAKFMLPDDRVKSFLDSFHGLSSSLGDMRVANCSSCHGNHGILPPDDPRSSINPANLGKTCGGCHPGAENRFISEPVHKTDQSESFWMVGLVRNVYIFLILMTIGGMLIHNLMDLFFKSTKGEPYSRLEQLKPRFSINERVQHATLAISFIVLAYSGFVLKFPDSIIALPFHWFSAGAVIRGMIHRGAAVIFVLVCSYHLLYLAFSIRGRSQFMHILPRPGDLVDLKNVMFKYLRNTPGDLELSHYTYVEKAEYWALIWGSAVMTVTGLVLIFNDIVLSQAPLWVAELATAIHYYEAILAVSAIIVWHGYWIVFDPEYYPLNLTWLYGTPRPDKTEKPEGFRVMDNPEGMEGDD